MMFKSEKLVFKLIVQNDLECGGLWGARHSLSSRGTNPSKTITSELFKILIWNFRDLRKIIKIFRWKRNSEFPESVTPLIFYYLTVGYFHNFLASSHFSLYAVSSIVFRGYPLVIPWNELQLPQDIRKRLPFSSTILCHLGRTSSTA